MKHTLLASFAVLALAACGPKSKTTTTTTTGPDTETHETETEPTFSGPLQAGQWETMDHESREAFMKQVVKPEMAKIFQGYDAQEFSDFGCDTCHGDGAKDGSFKMPNPDLPQLTGDLFGPNPPEDMKAILELMETQVKPTMVNLLGMEAMDQTHPDGFGCGNCHTFKQ